MSRDASLAGVAVRVSFNIVSALFSLRSTLGVDAGAEIWVLEVAEEVGAGLRGLSPTRRRACLPTAPLEGPCSAIGEVFTTAGGDEDFFTGEGVSFSTAVECGEVNPTVCVEGDGIDFTMLELLDNCLVLGRALSGGIVGIGSRSILARGFAHLAGFDMGPDIGVTVLCEAVQHGRLAKAGGRGADAVADEVVVPRPVVIEPVDVWGLGEFSQRKVSFVGIRPCAGLAEVRLCESSQGGRNDLAK